MEAQAWEGGEGKVMEGGVLPGAGDGVAVWWVLQTSFRKKSLKKQKEIRRNREKRKSFGRDFIQWKGCSFVAKALARGGGGPRWHVCL